MVLLVVSIVLETTHPLIAVGATQLNLFKVLLQRVPEFHHDYCIGGDFPGNRPLPSSALIILDLLYSSSTLCSYRPDSLLLFAGDDSLLPATLIGGEHD